MADPYRPDFYVAANIIGWTGDIDGDSFTVYFADSCGNPPRTVRIGTADQIVVQFGHITQKHECPFNEGREEVGESFSYSVYNEGGRMHEAVLGDPGVSKLAAGQNVKKSDHNVFHDSRGKFNPVTKGSVDRLAQVITRCKELKTRYTDKPGFDAWCIKNWGRKLG